MAEETPEISLQRLRAKWESERGMARDLKRQGQKMRAEAAGLIDRADERMVRAEAGIAEVDEALRRVRGGEV